MLLILEISPNLFYKKFNNNKSKKYWFNIKTWTLRNIIDEQNRTKQNKAHLLDYEKSVSSGNPKQQQRQQQQPKEVKELKHVQTRSELISDYLNWESNN